uniref:Uncharacterized protein n=1 Tax=Anguilla anguilla TaxID=7936 RepID=A0A0E9XVN7_ANGAN
MWKRRKRGFVNTKNMEPRNRAQNPQLPP